MNLKAFRAQASKRVGRLLYRLPFLSARDPRRRLTTIRQCCLRVLSFPPAKQTADADCYFSIRPSEVLRRHDSTGLDDLESARFQAGSQRYQNGNNFEIPEVVVACLNNARIFSRDFLVLTEDKRILLDSALSNRDVLDRNGILERVFWPRAQHMPGSYCLLANPWSNAYYHWVIDILPRLSSLEIFQDFETLPLIVPDSLRNFQRESLALAGVATERLAPFDGTYWQIDRLYFPELLSPTGNPSPHAVDWLRARFLKDPESTRRPYRMLYVTRRDAPNRKIMNEDEVIAWVRNKGFEIICPGELSFQEQIEIFREARIVIGPHGAGFTNMVFAPSTATLVEFFGDNYINGCFWALTNVRGQKHAFLTTATDTLNYSISIDRLNKLLRKVCDL